MKEFQLTHNHTTLAESKRLLAAGVPANTADCYHWCTEEGYTPGILPYGCTYNEYIHGKDNYTPCWSVSQLIFVLIKASLCDDSIFTFCKNKPQLDIDHCIKGIEANKEYYDFSKALK